MLYIWEQDSGKSRSACLANKVENGTIRVGS